MKTSELYCNDQICPDCGEEPVLLRCHLCGCRGMVNDCGHFDRPRPLDTSQGVDWPVIICHHCERQQEHVVSLIRAIMPENTREDVTTQFRRAVNIALRLGTPESGKLKLTTNQAVSYVWNDGRYQAGIQAMINREEEKTR